MDDGSGSGGGISPSGWMSLADSSLAALLRMLADVPDPDTVAATIAGGALHPFRPAVVVIGFVRPHQQVLTLDGLSGADPEVRRVYAALPLDTDSPPIRCVRTNSVVITPMSQVADEYPLVAPYLDASPTAGEGEQVLAPLRYRGDVVGVLGLEFAHRIDEPWHLRSALGTVSGPLAMWAVLRRELEDRAEVPPRRRDRRLAITERQKQIVALVRQGRTNAQIAAEIGFSVPTVKSELNRLSALLGASSRTDLADRATRAGL